MRTNPRPTPDAIGAYYPDDYGPYRGTRVDLERRVAPWQRWVKSLVHRVFEFNAQRLPPAEPGRLLEIGCASGAFLHEMAGKGWRVEGIEFSDSASESARRLGYNVWTGSIERAAGLEGDYDLVVGWMVLEHLHEPVLALRKLHDWSKPGAYLAISTPNAGSWERSLFSDRWYAFHLPAHLYHYTPSTLAAVLKAGGWQQEKIFHQRLLGNIFGSAGYVLEDRQSLHRLAASLRSMPERARLMNYALYPLALPLAAFGQTGRMTTWARRIDD